jgi:rubrerythrin
MTIEEAIKTAIVYETKIRKLYEDALSAISDDIGRRIFRTLGDDEQHHLDYLNYQLDRWQQTGRIDDTKLQIKIPQKDQLSDSISRLKSQMAQDDRGLRQQLLGKALKAEIETSAFYKRLVDELPEEGQAFFAHFLTIENNHIDAVQFELDFASQAGYWFDIKEFDME